MNRMNSLLLLFVKIETQHIAGRQVPVIQIFAQLSLAIRIIAWFPPDLQFDNVLLSEVIDDDIRSALVTGLRFDLVVSGSIDDRFQIQQELLSPVFFTESFLKRPIDLCIGFDKPLHDQPHIQFSVRNKQILSLFSLS